MVNQYCSRTIHLSVRVLSARRKTENKCSMRVNLGLLLLRLLLLLCCERYVLIGSALLCAYEIALACHIMFMRCQLFKETYRHFCCAPRTLPLLSQRSNAAYLYTTYAIRHYTRILNGPKQKSSHRMR